MTLPNLCALKGVVWHFVKYAYLLFNTLKDQCKCTHTHCLLCQWKSYQHITEAQMMTNDVWETNSMFSINDRKTRSPTQLLIRDPALKFMLGTFWTWKTCDTHRHTHTTTYLSFFPLIVMSQRPWNTFFRNTRVRLKLMTSSSGHTTTVPLTTRRMTSLVQVMHNNRSSNTTLCHWPIKDTETWDGGGITWPCATHCVCLTSHPKCISDRPGGTKQKMGPIQRFPLLRYRKYSLAILPILRQESETWDMTPHTWRGISPWLRPDTSSVETVSLSDWGGSDP